MLETTVRHTWRARVALALSPLAASAALGLLGGCAAPQAAPTSAQVAPGAAPGVRVDDREAGAPASETVEPAADAAQATVDAGAGATAWTDRFAQKAVIVADHVRIEGPEGLLDHVVVSADDVFYERTVTHDGATLTQVTMRLSDEVPIIRAQLDQWQIAAFRRVTVVERGEPCDVTVVATGDASLRDPLGKEERGETLRWVGTIPR